MTPLLAVAAAALVAQAAPPELVTILQLVNAGGTVALLAICLWFFSTNRVVTGARYDAVVKERDDKDEQIRALHRDAAEHAKDVQDKVIPALVETTLVLRDMRRG